MFLCNLPINHFRQFFNCFLKLECLQDEDACRLMNAEYRINFCSIQLNCQLTPLTFLLLQLNLCPYCLCLMFEFLPLLVFPIQSAAVGVAPGSEAIASPTAELNVFILSFLFCIMSYKIPII